MAAQARQRDQVESEAESTVSSTSAAPSTSGTSKKSTVFDERVKASKVAIQNGDFETAVRLYTEALALDTNNYVLYSNRSAALMRLGRIQEALEDATNARVLNPTWPKAYYREGVALQGLGRHAEALATFATGLAQDPKSSQLLSGMVETAHKSPLKEKFGVLYRQLEKMRLSQSPFVVIAVLGQELVSAGCLGAAVIVLESALRIGTCSLKLRGSVFSALSSAHWGVGHTDKAIACMLQDLAIAKSLADQEGECRAHGNLGVAYFSKGGHHEALTHHRAQLVLALRLKDRSTAASVLGSLGHVYSALSDLPNALASHKQCVLLLKQEGDKIREAREIGNIGAVYLAMGDVNSALECHREHLKLAKQLGNKQEEARAYSNLGSAHHYKREYTKAEAFHQQVLSIGQELNDQTLQARAYAGLGHSTRCRSDFAAARAFHEQQLDIALKSRDKVGEGRACSNLGIVYQHLAEYDAALKLHQAHLATAKQLCDRTAQGRAYGNIGNAYSSMGQHDLAIRFHKQELEISREVSDKHAEMSTHGNLAVSYQALTMNDHALSHYETHLKMARELKDTNSEARALNNLANFNSAQKNFSAAVPYYEQYLTLAQELQDMAGESKACHRLGYAHYRLGNFREAVRYYQQDLEMARDSQDVSGMCRAYCNLGLAHKALTENEEALKCQQQFLASAQEAKNDTAEVCALGNIGDMQVKLGHMEEAVETFKKQLDKAKVAGGRNEAGALANLGAVHRLIGDLDNALTYHTQELVLWKKLKDSAGQRRAHGSLGAVHLALGEYEKAYECYQSQLHEAQEIGDTVAEAAAYGNLAAAKMGAAHLDEAIGLLEQQLATLAPLPSGESMLHRAKAYGSLGDCYEALGDYDEAVRMHEQYLALAQTCGSVPDQDRAYRGLGNAHRAMGNLQQALVCFEKRLVVAHELDQAVAKASAYGELGCLHSLLGNYEQAVSCLQHQMALACEMEDWHAEGDAACGLGGVYQQMADYERALEYHSRDLTIATEMDNPHAQCRAFGNLGLSYESLGNYEEAIRCQEQHLAIATQIEDTAAKTLAYSSLGRVHHAMGQFADAVRHLESGLEIAEKCGRREDEAKIRHRLGLALWGHGSLEEAQHHLYRAAELFENIRRDALISTDYKLSLFDLQTASYQALQRVLVALGRTDEALIVAERGRTRAFVDFLMERQQEGADTWYGGLDSSPVTKEHVIDTVQCHQAAVLCYSIAAGFLYTWLILPDKGIVHFHESNVSELEANSDPEDCQSLRSLSLSSASLLDQYVGNVRDHLGVDAHLSTPRMSASRSSLSRLSLSRLSVRSSSFALSETESEADDIWQRELGELGDRLNAEADRTGFLRTVNRHHVFNASNLSLGSVFSVGSGVRSSSRKTAMQSGKAPASALYELLIGPMEEALNSSGVKDLVLVLQGDLYLVPFALLRASQTQRYLYERFNLLVVPSIRALQSSHKLPRQHKYNPNCVGGVVVSNPRLPGVVVEQWSWIPLPAADAECRTVAEMLGCKPLSGTMAAKETVMTQMQHAEVLHFATHISWKLAAIVLSPGEMSGGTTSMHGNLERMDLNESTATDSSVEGPPLADFLLTAADILNTRLSARLVVLSSGHTEDRAGRINTDGVVGLTRAFIAAGAQCVLFCLWPIPEMAARMLMKAFYTGLLQGSKVSCALMEAMRTVQTTRQFAHPSNWAGWMLVGADIRLSSKVALMGHALCELLQTPAKSREAMRVVLHLVEKSLQRIHHGQRHAMYTTQQSIENKVGAVSGWRDLLTAVGFRLEPPVNGLPAAVFFPTSDPGDHLAQCSASLQALLGLPVPTLTALSKMVIHPDVGEAITSLVREVNGRFTQESTVQLPVPVRLWRAPGCHEFLASLGFDLVDVGKDEITVKSGKQANRRTLSFALQALVAVFDTQEAPRTLLLDSSSSMESLESSGSATSTSNFSKGSSPPGSPSNKRRSFFNPAEVNKLPSAGRNNQNPGRTKAPSSSSPGTASDISLHLVHQNMIRAKYSSPGSTSDTSASGAGDDTDDGGHYWGQGLHGNLPAQPQPQPYSSDSEDANGMDPRSSGDLHRASHTRSSTSSTLTLKSTGSIGTRRSRIRSSQTSTKSSASDRTLTGDTPPDSASHRSENDSHKSGEHHKVRRKSGDTHLDSVSLGSSGGFSDRQGSGRREKDGEKHSLHDDHSERSHRRHASGDRKHDYERTEIPPGMNAAHLAQMVLSETEEQRAAVLHLQSESVRQLQQRRLRQEHCDSSAAKLQKPVASVSPSVYNHSGDGHSGFNLSFSSSTSLSPSVTDNRSDIVSVTSDPDQSTSEKSQDIGPRPPPLPATKPPVPLKPQLPVFSKQNSEEQTQLSKIGQNEESPAGGNVRSRIRNWEFQGHKKVPGKDTNSGVGASDENIGLNIQRYPESEQDQVKNGIHQRTESDATSEKSGHSRHDSISKDVHSRTESDATSVSELSSNHSQQDSADKSSLNVSDSSSLSSHLSPSVNISPRSNSSSVSSDANQRKLGPTSAITLGHSATSGFSHYKPPRASPSPPPTPKSALSRLSLSATSDPKLSPGTAFSRLRPGSGLQSTKPQSSPALPPKLSPSASLPSPHSLAAPQSLSSSSLSNGHLSSQASPKTPQSSDHKEESPKNWYESDSRDIQPSAFTRHKPSHSHSSSHDDHIRNNLKKTIPFYTGHGDSPVDSPQSAHYQNSAFTRSQNESAFTRTQNSFSGESAFTRTQSNASNVSAFARTGHVPFTANQNRLNLDPSHVNQPVTNRMPSDKLMVSANERSPDNKHMASQKMNTQWTNGKEDQQQQFFYTPSNMDLRSGATPAQQMIGARKDISFNEGHLRVSSLDSSHSHASLLNAPSGGSRPLPIVGDSEGLMGTPMVATSPVNTDKDRLREMSLRMFGPRSSLRGPSENRPHGTTTSYRDENGDQVQSSLC